MTSRLLLRRIVECCVDLVVHVVKLTLAQLYRIDLSAVLSLYFCTSFKWYTSLRFFLRTCFFIILDSWHIVVEGREMYCTEF